MDFFEKSNIFCQKSFLLPEQIEATLQNVTQEGFSLGVIVECRDLCSFIFPSLYVKFKWKLLPVSYIYS